ncbi:PTS sugar transporter subunit IIB [Kallotenue papyrolyticum]|uniref:PTS sugar transporter subunit IIB n=1 Tax=Kallotenue papyrolyticum TaxID=1325125 RepID=UPI000492B615|nr:PTS sugar transporter subunit IIB [Kallotenue papyrolyticum]
MAKRFQILILCGTGIATSTVVKARIESALNAAGLSQQVDIRQGKVADVLSGSDADLIVATVQVPASVTAPAINAVPLLTGVGMQPVLDRIVAAVREGGVR